MHPTGGRLAEIVAALEIRYGRSAAVEGPGSSDDDVFARVVAVLIGRATNPRKAAAAVEALRDDGLLDPAALASAPPEEVAQALDSRRVVIAPRALGPVVRVARWLSGRGSGAAPLADAATEALRDELAAIRGVGPATADALLLEALDRPVFPVDRASFRIAVRHGRIDVSAGYEEARSAWESASDLSPIELRTLSDGLDRVGRDYCRPRVAQCDECPLRPFLPPGGPVESDGD